MTKEAGRYTNVTAVTTRTVAESSTVSFVRLNMFLLINRAVDWPLRFRATANYHETVSQSSIPVFLAIGLTKPTVSCTLLSRSATVARCPWE